MALILCILGNWEYPVDIGVLPMIDFSVTLGMDVMLT